MENQIYLDIELKPAPLQSKRQLLISDEIIKWGDSSINAKDVTEVRYGSIVMGTMGIQTNQQYSFKFKDKSGKDLAIYFSSVSLAAPNQKLEEAYHSIEDAVWNAVTSKIIDAWIAELNKGGSISVGDIILSPAGLKIKVSRLFSSHETLIPWNDAEKELNNGYLYIHSKTNKKEKCSISIQNDWNGIALYYLLNWLWKENRREELLKKVK